MKTYGDFDKFMDKAKRVSRYVLPGVAVALTASCTQDMLNAIVTTPTPEVSPLPSDFTKTPMLSPTEANYELTPTVQNPATQELTLTPEPTATATEIPATATEKPLIEGNIFFDPQSKEDFKEVALSPSPLDEPEKFALWQEEYLKLVKDKMTDFEGQAIDRQVGIEHNSYQLHYVSIEWSVISAYKFKWQGQEILTKTFLYQDKLENLIPVSLTYAPEGSWFFDNHILYPGHIPFLYETLPADELRSLSTLFFYGDDRKKAIEKDRKPEEVFMEEYLGNDVSDETKAIIMNIWGNRATAEDIDSFSKMRFLLWFFQKY